MSIWQGIVWLFVLLFFNAFFVGAEFAVISARRSQIEPLADAGNKRARIALWAMEHATLMLATSQLGITVCSLIILNVSEPAIQELLSGPLLALGLAPDLVYLVGFILTLILVSFLHVVVGEMIPKNAAFSVPDKAVLILAPPLVLISRIINPLIWSLNAIANGILRLFGIEPKSETTSTYTLEEVASIVSHSQREGILQDRTGTLTAAFEFTTKVAQDLTVPRDTLITIGPDASLVDVETKVAKHGFSRYIVEHGDGTFQGYVHIKDLLWITDEHAHDPLPSQRIRPLLTVNAEEDLEDVLAALQTTGIHLAHVRDANGEERGVLFLEDVIEELVGEVHDATRRPRFD